MSKSIEDWVQSAVGPPLTLIWRHPSRLRITPVNEVPNFSRRHAQQLSLHSLFNSAVGLQTRLSASFMEIAQFLLSFIALGNR